MQDDTPTIGDILDTDMSSQSILRPSPKDDSHKGAKLLLDNIDNRIAWLAERGLNPHPGVLARRSEVLKKITQYEHDSDS